MTRDLGKIASALLLITTTSLLIGCQKSSDGSPASAAQLSANPPLVDPPKPSPEPPLEPPKKTYTELVDIEMRKAIDGGFRRLTTGFGRGGSGGSVDPVYCAPGVDCQSKYVGVSLSKAGSGGYCSGVLIAKDLVLTNRHCAEVMVSAANQSFGGGMVQVVVPGKDKTETYGPMNIGANFVMISPTDVVMPLGSPDWAILKVYDGTPIKLPVGMSLPKINREGIIAGQKYFVYSKSPYADAEDKNEIEKRECKAIYGTAFGPWFNTPKSAMIELSDCPIGPGNSGSPIYNEAGELVGLIAGQFNPNLMNSLSALSLADYKLSTEMFQPVGWGMTMACIPDISSGAKLPEECNAGLGMTTGLLAIPEDLQNKIVAKVNEFAKSKTTSEKFQFETIRAQNTNSLAVISQALFMNIPSCVLRDELKTLVDKDHYVLISVAGAKLSKFGVLTGEVSEPLTMPAQLDVNVDELIKSKVAPMTVKILGLPMHQGILKICD